MVWYKIWLTQHFREEEDEIVTPFAQILATLKDVRSSLAMAVSRQRQKEKIQNNSGPHKAFLDKFRESSKHWIMETLLHETRLSCFDVKPN